MRGRAEPGGEAFPAAAMPQSRAYSRSRDSCIRSFPYLRRAVSVLRRDGHAQAFEIVGYLDLTGQAAVRLAPVGEGEDGFLVRLDRREAVDPILGDIDVAGAAACAASADAEDLVHPAALEIVFQRDAGLGVDLARVAASRRGPDGRHVSPAPPRW